MVTDGRPMMRTYIHVMGTQAFSSKEAGPLYTQSLVRSAAWGLISARSSARSREGFFSRGARQQRLSTKSKRSSQGEFNGTLQRHSNDQSAKQAAARTRALKQCRSAQQMLATLQGFVDEGASNLNSVHLGLIYTRVPRFPAAQNIEKEAILDFVRSDLERIISSEFPDPTRPKQRHTFGMTSVVWGMIQMGMSDNPHCQRSLGMLIEHIDQCNSTTLAVAIDCLAALGGELVPTDRLHTLIKARLLEADGQSLSRYLYCCGKLNVSDKVLMHSLAERILEVEQRKPQHCSNAALTLSRQGVDAERLVTQLASKVLQLELTPNPQDIANIFLALHERGWRIEKHLAISLLDGYIRSQRMAIPYNHVQVMTGVEAHGVRFGDVDLKPLVEHLLTRCPKPLRPSLQGVSKSLQAVGYPVADHISQLSAMAGNSENVAAKA